MIVLLALAIGAAGCGGGGDEAGGGDTQPPIEMPTETTTFSGKEIFTFNCGGCHTLADAGTSGTVGPNLDALAPDTDRVATQVRNGGGGMPSFEGQLSEDEIQAVAEYVSSVAGA